LLVASPGREILVFEIAGRRYGLPATEVRELVRAVAIVPLPMAPPGVEGVVNLRGRVVPVIDLRARLGLASRPVAPSDHMIVVSLGQRLAALRVDRALDLVRLDGETRAREESAGMPVAQLADGLAPLLEVRTLLAAGDLDTATLAAVQTGARVAGELPP
jgi:purine-binding chemotaxis protein CheW